MNLSHQVVVDRERGLPSSQVHRIALDAQGRLWMAGPSGLCCYDGSRVRSFDRRNGLRCAGLRTVAIGADTTLWIGTDLGLEAIGRDERPLDLLHGLAWPYGLVGCAVPGDGEVWLGTSQGLLHVAEPAGAARLLAHHPLGYVRDLVRLRAGALLAVSAHLGLHRIAGANSQALELPAALAPNALRRVAARDDGGFAVASTHAVWIFDAEGRPLGAGAVVPGEGEVGALAARGAQVWVGAGFEVFGYEHDGRGGLRRVQAFAVASKVNDLLVDDWGSVWVATDTAGVARLSGLSRALERIDVGASVYALRPGPGTSLLVGGDGFAAALQITGEGPVLSQRTRLPSTVWDLAPDPVDGSTWLATHAGLYHCPVGGRPQPWHDAEGLLSAPCRVLLHRDGVMWVGTLSGLVRVQGGVARAVPGADGVPLGYVYNLQLDDDRRLWVGTLGRGLWREGPDGLQPVVGGPLTDRSNTYVVAMGPSPGQVLVVQDERIVLIESGRPPQLLAHEYPVGGWTALWLDAQRVAIGSSDGLRIFDCRSGQVERRINALYDPGVWEFTNNRALLRGPDTRLYCGLNGGLVAVDVEALDAFRTPPRAALAGLAWQQARPQADGPWWVVDPGKWSLEVQVFAAWLLDEQRVSFRYRLVGFEAAWSEPMRQPAIRYSSLPPGEYLLQVQAQAPLTGPGEAVTLLRLRVRRKPLDAVLGNLAAVYDRLFGTALRNRRLLRRHAELEAEVTARRAAEALLERHRAGLEQQVQERTRELQAARDEAQRANRAKSEFLSRMSHELRTPMNALLGFAQLMEIDRNVSPRNRVFVKEMLTAGRHLLALINDVLDLAQIEASAISLQLEPLLLTEVVHGCVHMIGPAAMQAGVSIDSQGLAPWKVVADRTRLRQVLLNLMSNAVKYNHRGGLVRIEAHAAAGDRVRIVVVDTGPGIAPQRQGELFQPFSRLGAELGQVEGTGIGLAIVRQLVERMAGAVGVDSHIGEGSRFWFELPAAAAPPEPAQLAALAAGATPPQRPITARATVLCVEDNAANRMVVEHVVGRHAGLRLLMAATAAEGLALARSERPDLILLDLQLPDMDGYHVLEQLRADAATAQLPVVAVTAYAMSTDRQQTLAAGFIDHVAKPVDIESFDAMLERWLPHRPGPPPAAGAVTG